VWLHKACISKPEELPVPLLSKLVCRLQDGSTPLHYAAAFGQTHVLETLVKAGIAIDNRDDAQNTPLHLAAGCASSSSSAAM